MKINGKKIAEVILKTLKKEVKKLKKKPQLAVFLVGQNEENLSFVKMKEKATKKIGGKFQLYHFKKTPPFETFVNCLKTAGKDSNITGIVIQKPLPASLNTESLFDYIPAQKEIEGQKKKSYFYPPLGLAVLTILKYIFFPSKKKSIKELLVTKKDKLAFKNIFKRKKVVLIGRGETGGKPIGKTLSEFKINYLNIHSQTPSPEIFYQEAEIIISAVGKKVLNKNMIKPGTILINVGLRKENGVWKGDYDDEEIKNIASFYTPTPGGIGPLDIAYLMNNLVEATKNQQKTNSRSRLI